MTSLDRPPRIDDRTADGLRRGDPHAFEELYVELRGGVYNLAARIVGDRGEAEDITQEVFLRAFHHLPGKTEEVRPEAWVYRTTVNACFDHLRRRRPAPVDVRTTHEAAGGDAYAQAAIAAAVEETLDRLSPRYRTALVLKDLHGLGNGEIAEIMGVARGTVGVLLFRARSAFRKHYREVAPTLGAAVPAGLAVWLPPLALPPGLATIPAFPAPGAAPTLASPPALGPLAPVAATAAPPVAAGLGKLAGALTTRIAVVTIAATVATGGGIVAYETHGADSDSRPATLKSVPGAVAVSYRGGEHSHAKTHAGLAAEMSDDGQAGEGSKGMYHGGATPAGDGTHGPSDGSDGGRGDTEPVRSGEGSAAGSGQGSAATTGSGSAAATDGGSDGGAHAGDQTHNAEGDGVHAGDGGGTHTTDGDVTQDGGSPGGTAPAGGPAAA